MNENELLKVLERIKQLLKNDLLIETKEYVDLEIENLKEIQCTILVTFIVNIAKI